MRLALWQDHSPMGDETVALARIHQAASAGGALGATMVVLPEVFLPGYNQTKVAQLAVPRTAPVFDKIAAICCAANCGVVVGYAESEEGVTFNSARAIDANGTTLAHYRKIQLFGPREKGLYTPGTAYTIFELQGHKAALLICYDIEFAPHVGTLAAQGVTIILVPTANMEPFDHVVRHTVATMAANYGVTIVYANYCGLEGDLTYVGGSLIAGPHGEILAQAGRGPAFLLADVPVADPVRLSTQNADFQQVSVTKEG